MREHNGNFKNEFHQQYITAYKNLAKAEYTGFQILRKGGQCFLVVGFVPTKKEVRTEKNVPKNTNQVS